MPIQGLKGDDLSNAMMKAVTKAKRRAILSMTGLGFLDESEVGSIQGARVVTVDAGTGEILDTPGTALPSSIGNDTNPYAGEYWPPCPIHGVDWQLRDTEKYGRLISHRQDNSWCKLGNAYKQVFSDLWRELFWQDPEAKDFQDWCKAHFDGRTWSKMTDEERVEAVDILQAENEPDEDEDGDEADPITDQDRGF